MSFRDLDKLQKKIGVNFKDENLLRQAMVHRSYLNEHADFEIGHNERLEFLGDAVLEIIVTEFLYLNFVDKPEGDLTNWRASLVNAKMLYEVAQEISLDSHLYLSKGESKDKNKKSRQFILANAIEAIIGAIYLDQGIKKCQQFINKHILNKLDDIIENELYLDPKSSFQEKSQEEKGITPHYQVLDEEGPDHAKNFTVGLYIGEDLITTSKGSSKQEAQIKAAAKGLKKLGW